MAAKVGGGAPLCYSHRFLKVLNTITKPKILPLGYQNSHFEKQLAKFSETDYNYIQISFFITDNSK